MICRFERWTESLCEQGVIVDSDVIIIRSLAVDEAFNSVTTVVEDKAILRQHTDLPEDKV